MKTLYLNTLYLGFVIFTSLLSVQCSSGGNGDGGITPSVTCTSPQVLQNGVCVNPIPSCVSPQVLQNGVCVNPIPSCVSPQVLQNGVCVNPTPSCVSPQVVQNGVCANPIPSCVSPQVLQNGVCVTPQPGSFSITWQSGFSSSQTFMRNQSISALATAVNGTIAWCTASSLPAGITFEKTASGCLISGSFTIPKVATIYNFSATSTDGKSASASLNITVSCSIGSFNANGICPFGFSYPQVNYVWATISNVNIPNPTINSGSAASFSVYPTLPVWLTLNTVTGAMSGNTPNSIYSLTVYTISAISTDYVTISVKLGITVVPTVDIDGNGLIEIISVEQLDNIRNALDGRWYSVSGSLPVTMGCPIPIGGTSNICKGYELKKNLDFTGTKWASNCTGAGCVTGGWAPLGDDVNTPFTATFNGNGYNIQNLYINRSQQYIGFFGYASSNSSITNLGLINLFVSGNVGNVDNSKIGGLVGYTEGTITLSYASIGTVSGSGDATSINMGGLVGNQNAGTISDSYASCSVTWNGDVVLVGGLVGLQNSATIRNSYALGLVSATGGGISYSIGGLVGEQRDNGTIRNSYATGSVLANGAGNSTGGLVGNQEKGTITNTYSMGSVTGNGNYSSTGGLVGQKILGNTTISNSYATGLVSNSSPTYRGGLVGNKIGSSNISNNYWDITTTGQPTWDGTLTNGGLTTMQMQTTSGAVGTYPSGLNTGSTCFNLTDGKYPRLLALNGSACTTLLFGPNKD